MRPSTCWPSSRSTRDEPLGAVGQLHRPVEARQHRVEAAGLQRRRAGQLRARDAARESRGSSRCGCSCRPGRPAPTPRPRTCCSPSDPRVHRRREAGRPAAQHDQIEALARRPPPAGRARGPPARPTGCAAPRSWRTSTGVSSRGDVEPVEVLVALSGSSVDVVPAHRHQVALEQVADLEGARDPRVGDQAQRAVAEALVPGAAGQQACASTSSPRRDAWPDRAPPAHGHHQAARRGRHAPQRRERHEQEHRPPQERGARRREAGRSARGRQAGGRHARADQPQDEGRGQQHGEGAREPEHGQRERAHQAGRDQHAPGDAHQGTLTRSRTRPRVLMKTMSARSGPSSTRTSP